MFFYYGQSNYYKKCSIIKFLDEILLKRATCRGNSLHKLRIRSFARMLFAMHFNLVNARRDEWFCLLFIRGDETAVAQ